MKTMESSGNTERARERKKMEKMESSGNTERRYSKVEEALEVESLRRIISAYLNYPKAAEKDVRRYERSLRKLSPEHKALLSHLPSKFHSIRRCISINSFFIQSMLQAFEPPIDMNQDIDIGEDKDWENDLRNNDMRQSEANLKNRSIGSEESASTCRDDGVEVCTSPKRKDIVVFRENFHESSSECLSATSNNDVNMTASCQDDLIVSNGKVDPPPRYWLDPSLQLKVPLGDVEKVRCIIRNIVRDWAPEGQAERDQCYKPILQELDRLFPSRCKSRPPCCLIPGAGLGRLALEISCLGFISQGNEFSYYMMICSSFILNYTEDAGEWTIYPWVHSNCNSLSDKDQLRPVSFPDIHPAGAGITEGFSMCGGDFVEVYNDPSQEGSWDAVVTCFFLDTAHNIVEYIEIISRILVDGGVWINLGPLLYHFADAYGQDEMSIEISLEDVKKIAFDYGFQMEVERTIETTYTGNSRSMMQARNCSSLNSLFQLMYCSITE